MSDYGDVTKPRLRMEGKQPAVMTLPHGHRGLSNPSVAVENI